MRDRTPKPPIYHGYRAARYAVASATLLCLTLAAACTSIESAPNTVRSAQSAAPAQTAPETSPPPARLVRHAYESTATSLERDYYVYLPAGYDEASERRWPVMLFLHGHGERGDGKEELGWVMKQGPLYEAWIQKRDLPFVIVSPQLPMFDMKTSAPYLEFRNQAEMPAALADGVPARPAEFPTPGPMTGAVPDPELPFGIEGPPSGWNRCEEDVLGILEFVLATYRVDPDRLYLTGVSYGGFGTWYLASRHAERFAAIAPVVGWGHPDLMPPLADPPMPMWVFAGGRDPAVLTKHFFPGLNALEKLGHPNVRFTIHEDMNHDVWERVYGGRDIYDWLLGHRRAASDDEQ